LEERQEETKGKVLWCGEEGEEDVTKQACEHHAGEEGEKAEGEKWSRVCAHNKLKFQCKECRSTAPGDCKCEPIVIDSDEGEGEKVVRLAGDGGTVVGLAGGAEEVREVEEEEGRNAEEEKGRKVGAEKMMVVMKLATWEPDALDGGEIGLEEAQEDVTEDVGGVGEDRRGGHPHTRVQACADRGGGGAGGGGGTGRRKGEMVEPRVGRRRASDARVGKDGAGSGDSVEGFNLLFALMESDCLLHGNSSGSEEGGGSGGGRGDGGGGRGSPGGQETANSNLSNFGRMAKMLPHAALAKLSATSRRLHTRAKQVPS
jgi:hypothetical protein